MIQKKIFIILISILVVASFFRLFSLPSVPPGLYPDEAMNGNNALESIDEGFKVFYPENNGREGLFINIQAISLKFFMMFSETPQSWMLRFPSALFGILTVLGIYFLTKELLNLNSNFETLNPKQSQNSNNQNPKRFRKLRFWISDLFRVSDLGFRISRNKSIALLSSFLLAVSFWHINFSRIGFRAIMAPFFLVWGIYLLLLSFKKREGSNFIWIWLLPILAGAVYGLGMHSYIAYRATPILILFILWLLASKYEWKNILKVGGFFIIGSIIVSLPLLIYFAGNPADFLGRTTQVSIFSSPNAISNLALNSLKTLSMFFFVGDGNWRHNLAGAPELFPPVAICFAIGIAFGLYLLFKKSEEKKIFLILFAWLVVAALPVVVSNEGIPHALRAILMIPPAFILSAIGAYLLWYKLGEKMHKKLLMTFSALFVVVLIFNAYSFYFILWGERQETRDSFTSEFVSIAKIINKLPKEMPKYVVIEGGGGDVRGFPMPSQTTMFLTDSFTPEKQAEKNIHYLLPNQRSDIPERSAVFVIR